MLQSHSRESLLPQTFIKRIERNVATRPFSPAIRSQGTTLDYDQFWLKVNQLSKELKSWKVQRIAFAASNSASWVIFDLACIKADIVMIPVPHFFTSLQVRHLINNSSADLLVCDPSTISGTGDILGGDPEHSITVNETVLTAINCNQNPAHPPRFQDNPICKISYTSGTTGEPKGVYITVRSINNTVLSLTQLLDEETSRLHLCALPFSLLLENIAGIYAVLANGGCCVIPSFEELGLAGSSSVDMQKFSSLLIETRPTSLITVPALLEGLVKQAKNGSNRFDFLRFVAVGGAPVSVNTLNTAGSLGIPVYEGYGLTECGSVVSMNRPGCVRSGSIGKPLPHCSVNIAEDGEILVSGVDFRGYTNMEAEHDNYPTAYRTGDLGYIDDHGFIHITGRKSSVFCTPFGRNVSPDWVESELNSEGLIAQSAVFPDSDHAITAIIVPQIPDIDDRQIEAAVSNTNSRLPDYATVGSWIRAEQPFSITNRQMSGGGTIQRESIRTRYQHVHEKLQSAREVTKNEVL